MKYFSEQPSDRPIGYENDNQWKIVDDPWQCQWEYKGAVRRLSIPAGTIYDGTSAPRVAWTLTGILPDGLDRAGGLTHDVLYRGAGGTKPMYGSVLTSAQGNIVQVSREEADWVLYEFMRFAGVKRARCIVAYIAVRAFGRRYWGSESPSGMPKLEAFNGSKS